MTRNWGRWGSADERGCLNLIDEAATLRGLATAGRGRCVSLGLPLVGGRGPAAEFRPPVQHVFMRDGGDYAAGLDERPGYGYADDLLIVPCHGTTHIDALAHVWQDGTIYNGVSACTVTSRGAARSGAGTVGPIVTRGLFVDADTGDRPTESPIPIGLIDERLRASNVVPLPGDALLVRTGWLRDWRRGDASSTAWAGLDVDCTDWLDKHGIALVGADNITVEVQPSTVARVALPLHVALLRDRGLPLLELLDLEVLAETGAVEFLLVVSPLNLIGGSGSPVAPVAVL